MQLGKQTASINNHLLSRAVIGQPSPKLGMGATLLICATLLLDSQHTLASAPAFAIGLLCWWRGWFKMQRK